jgi:quaternary ammonium compound-resistance protein SugE
MQRERSASAKVHLPQETTTTTTQSMANFTPSSAQAWWLLAAAGLLEIAWAVGMKYTDGFSRPAPTLLVAIAALASFALLGLAMKALPVGTAYGVWVGIGAAGAALLGILLFGEPATWARIGCVLLIVAGVVGLKLADG